MSLLDSIIRPADLKALDPSIRNRIIEGVRAGAATAAAINAKTLFAGTKVNIRPQAAVAAKLTKSFQKRLR